jgi:hypothetical protein
MNRLDLCHEIRSGNSGIGTVSETFPVTWPNHVLSGAVGARRVQIPSSSRPTHARVQTAKGLPNLKGTRMRTC